MEVSWKSGENLVEVPWTLLVVFLLRSHGRLMRVPCPSKSSPNHNPNPNPNPPNPNSHTVQVLFWQLTANVNVFLSLVVGLSTNFLTACSDKDRFVSSIARSSVGPPRKEVLREAHGINLNFENNDGPRPTVTPWDG